jgi:hypothetical protein
MTQWVLQAEEGQWLDPVFSGAGVELGNPSAHPPFTSSELAISLGWRLRSRACARRWRALPGRVGCLLCYALRLQPRGSIVECLLPGGLSAHAFAASADRNFASAGLGRIVFVRHANPNQFYE